MGHGSTSAQKQVFPSLSLSYSLPTHVLQLIIIPYSGSHASSSSNHKYGHKYSSGGASGKYSPTDEYLKDKQRHEQIALGKKSDRKSTKAYVDEMGRRAEGSRR